MIKSLDLNDFGKFSGRKLEFGPFTVITGPNEAGKTTVFDALFAALCADSKNETKASWKRLTARYGTLRGSAVTWKKGFPPLSFDHAEFLEIFAIRGGETSVNASGGRSWEKMAEARLLNAGLNPAQLAEELADNASTTRKDSARARIKKLQKTLQEATAELAGAKTIRDNILAGEAEMLRLEAEKKVKSGVLAATRAKFDGNREASAALKAAGKLADALDGIKVLRELKEAKDELAGLAAFAVNELPAYRALQAGQSDREKALGAAQAALKEQKIALEAAEAALGKLFTREKSLKKTKARAENISMKLRVFASAPEVVTRTVSLPTRWGIWAAGAALATFVAYSGANIGGYAAGAAILGAAAWVGLKLSVREVLTGHTSDEIKNFLAKLAAEWAAVSRDPFPARNLEEARGFLAQPGAAYASAKENLAVKTQEAADLQARYEIMAGQNLAEIKGAAETAKLNAEKWLKQRGCASEDDYQAKISAYEGLAARISDLEERVKVFDQKYSCVDAEELKDKLFTEKEALERKGVDPAKANEPELGRLKARAAALSDEMQAYERTLAELNTALTGARAASGARLEGLPERINRAETGIAAANEEIADRELQIQAFALAAEVFNRLAATSNLAFEALGKEVSATLAAVLPGARAEFAAFDAGTASLKDAGGSLRKIEQLSSGARDLFMLAARITMAKKARTTGGKLSPALLVLDEPFYTLDAVRTQAALKLLAAFHKETGWQIVILTKDTGVAPAAKAAGAPVTEIKLGMVL